MGTLIRRFLASSFAALAVAVAPEGDACVLPVFVDATGETPSGWWTSDPSGSGDLERSLVEASSAWCAATGDSDSLGRVSAVLRALDLTPNNAVQLGAFVGADRVAVGTVTRVAAPDVAWLGLHRTVFVLTGRVLDAGSGNEVRTLELRAVAFGQSAAEADRAAFELLGTFAAQTVDDVATLAAGHWPSTPGDPVLVVTGGPSAAPYVAARTALRDASPGVVDLVEAWATEGAIGVHVALDEEATFSAYATAVRRLEGATLAGVVIDAVEMLDTGDVLVEVAPPSTAPCDGCAAAPPQ